MDFRTRDLIVMNEGLTELKQEMDLPVILAFKISKISKLFSQKIEEYNSLYYSIIDSNAVTLPSP